MMVSIWTPTPSGCTHDRPGPCTRVGSSPGPSRRACPAVESGVLTPGLPGRSLSSIFPCVFRRTDRCNRKAWLLTALPRSESSDHEGCLHPLISVSEPPSPHLLNGDICDVPFPPGLLASWAESLHRKSPGMQSPHGCARPAGHNGRWMECSWRLTTGSGFLILCGNAAWH